MSKSQSALRAVRIEPKPATVIVKMLFLDCIRRTEKIIDVELPVDVYNRMTRGK